MTYLPLEVKLPATTLYEAGVSRMAELAPDGWVPSPAEQWLLEAVARMGAELAIVSGKVDNGIFTWLGQTILGVPSLDAAPATSTVTFDLVDTFGHRIEGRTQLIIDGVTFFTDANLDIPTGNDQGTIGITAALPGETGNDLTGGSIDVLTPSYLFIANVTLDAPTAGGTDGEDGDEYADRLPDELPTLSTKAILLPDFVTFARRHPLVDRALGIDNLDADTMDDDAEGHVTIPVHDADGAALSGPDMAEIKAVLEAGRVLGITAHVIAPTDAPIAVAYQAIAYDGIDPVAAMASADVAADDYLDPTRWGSPDSGNTKRWVNEKTLYHADIVGAIKNVDEIRHVTEVLIGLVRGVVASASTDAITAAAHGRANGDEVKFLSLTGGGGLVVGTTYFVRDVTTNTFKVAATLGGPAVNLTSDVTAGTVVHLAENDLALPGIAPLTRLVSINGTVT